MTTPTAHPHSTATIDGVAAPVRIVGGDVKLAALDVPYATATVIVPLTADTALDELDPRDDHRVIVEASSTGHWETHQPGGPVWVPDPPRVFNLGLRVRPVRHQAKSVALQLASDEALLIDYTTLVEDNGARAHEGSVRGVVNYVLGKIGAQLQAGGPDADVTAYWTLQNLALDPDLSTPAALTPGGNAGPMNAGGAGPAGGAHSIYWSAQAAGFTWAKVTKISENVRRGQTITASAYMGASVAGRTGLIRIEVYNLAGGLIEGRSGPATPLPTGDAWQRVSTTWTITNPDAVKMAVFVYGSASAAGQAFGAANIDITEGAEVVPHFTGASTAPGYVYSWAGTVNDSVSTRTPLVPRSPDLFIWKPGVSAWEFLTPFTTSAGAAGLLRLFCDELRVWRLIDPAEYVVPGYVTVTPANATDGVDVISREDSDVFATGVVCRYAWKDPDGTAQTATDVAGTPEKVVVFDYARPYPGPGAAAAILARRNGSGRTQDVTGLAQWAATPGMAASITLPYALEQFGKITTVDWALDDTALMQIGTRGLIDVIPGSWLDWDPAQAWQAVPASVTWESLEGAAHG